MKLYGKKNNEIWYKGSLVDIQNKDGPLSEVKYDLLLQTFYKNS